MLRAEVDDMWYWIAWSLSGESAAEAKRILHELTFLEIARFYAIKTYHGSWKPKD